MNTSEVCAAVAGGRGIEPFHRGKLTTGSIKVKRRGLIIDEAAVRGGLDIRERGGFKNGSKGQRNERT